MDTSSRSVPARWLLPTGLVLALALTACGGLAATDGAAGDLTGDWVLVAGEGPEGPVPLPPTAPITLQIDGESWGGTAACNSYGGTVQVRNGRVTSTGFAVTEMACVDDEVMRAEAAYLAALLQVDRADRDGGDLVLTGPETSLRFAARIPEPEAALLGTAWQLVGLIAEGQPGDRAAGDDTAVTSVVGDAELELTSDGMVVGSTGCNRFHGSAEVDGTLLRLTAPLATTRMACEEPLRSQEDHVLAVLAPGEVTIALTGRTLTLTSQDGRGLQLQAPD